MEKRGKIKKNEVGSTKLEARSWKTGDRIRELGNRQLKVCFWERESGSDEFDREQDKFRMKKEKIIELTAGSYNIENSTVQHSNRLGLTAHTDNSVFDELTIKAC